jgi:V/A-type H+-transporting ATPase subunit I
LGDAGYGLFLVLLALLVRPRVKESLKPIFSLVIYLGSATVVLGFLSGTFFGINLIEADIPWLNSYKKLMLDSNQLFYFSLIIGVVQILFGMILKAINKVRRYGWAASFSTWGWLFLIVGCGIVYGLQTKEIISLDISQKMYYVVGGIAAIFIFLLNNIKRNVFINIGAGLWDSYNMITGFLGDVLSYIRLFALGISGAVMGFVFNDLALNLSGDVPVLSHLVMLLILLFGHGINIFMAGLSAFVHPMRLTFVEFYKNAGFEGGGKKYNPFKLKVKS